MLPCEYYFNKSIQVRDLECPLLLGQNIISLKPPTCFHSCIHECQKYFASPMKMRREKMTRHCVCCSLDWAETPKSYLELKINARLKKFLDMHFVRPVIITHNAQWSVECNNFKDQTYFRNNCPQGTAWWLTAHPAPFLTKESFWNNQIRLYRVFHYPFFST